MVQTYSNKRDGSRKLSPHFRVREFARDGVDEVKVDDELISQLEALYEELDCSKIIITSGYRPADTGSQHALGRAADVNCWHTVNGKEERYQGREILLAAEKVGIRGIGWIAGTAQSRAAVHLDTRDTPYRFDEADGNRKVKDNSWYAYFGVAKPGSAQPESTYTVKAGDNLSKIGASLDVPWREIAAANGIEDPWIIHPGQVLTIPGGGDPAQPSKPRTYTVVSGDSLSRIGSKLGVPWRKIAEANKIKFPWIIRPGQVLTIPEV